MLSMANTLRILLLTRGPQTLKQMRLFLECSTYMVYRILEMIPVRRVRWGVYELQ